MAIRSTFVTACGKHRAVMLNKLVHGCVGSAAGSGMRRNAGKVMSQQDIYIGFIQNFNRGQTDTVCHIFFNTYTVSISHLLVDKNSCRGC